MAVAPVYPVLSEMKLHQVHEEISVADSELTMAWCRRYGLLKTERTCMRCHNEMRLVVRSGVDGKIWQCGCPCRARVSVREGTFFAHSKLPLAKIIEFIYAWAYEDLTFKKAKREFGISQHTFVDWKMFLRDVCGEYFVAHPVRIGGVGHTVQIDESVFTRRKYNRGRMIREQWVFGGIDTQTKAGFMVPVDRRDAATLLPIIQQFILPGTTIVSDLWGAYNTVGNLGYAHLTVNHSVNFVDPLTFAHTNAVENFWMRSKFRSKKERGTSANLLPSYLQEFMWRQIFDGDPFQSIVAAIKEVYPQW